MMGSNTTARADRATQHTRTWWRGIAGVAGVALVIGVGPTPAQAGLLDGSADTDDALGSVTGILDPVLDPVTGVLDPVIDPVTGETIDPVVDEVSGVVTNPDTGEVIGTLDPDLGVLYSPVPSITGQGSITSLGGYMCTSVPGQSVTPCAPVPLDQLTPGTALVLVAQALPGQEVEWTCPEPIGDQCRIAPEELSALPLTPVAAFTATASAPPETTITGGRTDGAWVLTRAVRYRFASDTEDSTFRCSHRARGTKDVGDCAGSARYAQLVKGSHLFSVAASAGDQTDATPARRVFHVPVDDRALNAKKRWASKRAKGHFKTTYRQTRRKGAALSMRVRNARQIVLVADKGRGHGTVKVFLGSTLLKKVDLRARRSRTHRVIPIGTFSEQTSGRVRVVVASAGKVVRIDGLGVATR